MMKQIQRITKLLVVLLFLPILSSGNLYGQDAFGLASAHLTVDAKLTSADYDIPLEQFLDKLEEIYQVTFLYQTHIVEEEFVNVRQVSLNQMTGDKLVHILTDLGLSYTLLNEETYVLFEKDKKAALSKTQQKMITGTVTNAETGDPIANVNIVVRGTNLGTSTNEEGYYSLQGPSLQDTLVYSFIGYKSKVVPIRGRTEINVGLQPTAIIGEELVVVGYGTEERQNLTGAISSISSEQLENKPLTNATQALRGTKGVYIVQTGAQPGQSNATIKIRGQGTLNNNSPLVLVDGIAYSLSKVDPDNIKSISVLKGAAAAAIYGSRAANGVILVTTKSGEDVKGFQVAYNNYFGFNRAVLLPDFIQDPIRLMRLSNRAERNAGNSNVDFSEAVIEEYKKGMKTNPIVYPQNNWYDIMLDPSFMQNHSLRFYGGGEVYNFSLALGYMSHDGVLMGTGGNKYSLNLHATVNVTDKLKVQAIFGGQVNRFYEPPAGAEYLMRYTLKNASVPYEPTYLEDGRYADTWLRVPGHYSFRNPLAIANEGYNKHRNNSYRVSLKAQYEFPMNITYELTGGLTKVSNLNLIWEPAVYQYRVKSLEQVRTRITSSPNRHARNHDYEETRLTFRQILRWQQDLRSSHQFSVLLGNSVQSFYSHVFSAQREGYLGNGLTTLNAGSRNAAVSGTRNVWRLVSLFGQLEYNYREKYILQGSVRLDGSSKFGEAHKWGLYPSFSAAWRIGNEEFMENIDWISSLKLKASWGRLGNNRVPSYSYVSLIDLGHAYSFGSTVMPGAAITQYSDPDITWETTTTTNIGFIASFFENSLSLSIDIYNQKTSEILEIVPLPAQVGDLRGPLKNIGAVRNRGIEVGLSYQNSIGSFSYRIGGNISTVENKVVELNEQIIYNYGWRSGGGTIIKEGHPINEYYLIHAVGIFQNESQITNHAFQSEDTKPGYLIFEDVNNDDVINQDDRIFTGKNRIPDFTYSFSINLSYGNFHLGAWFNGVSGVYTFSNFWGIVPFWYGLGVTERWVNNSWTPENRDAKLPIMIPYPAGVNTNYRNSTFLLLNASYLRLKNLQLSYDIPQSLTNKLNISSAEVFVNAKNLFTITPLPAYDPEKNLSENRFHTYPSYQTFTAGIQIQF